MLIVGAGGCAKELLEIALQVDPEFDVVFYDDVSDISNNLFLDKYRILKSESDVREYVTTMDKRFIVGVGKPSLRSTLFEKFCALGCIPSSLISPRSAIGRTNNIIGDGTAILTNAIVESSNTIGRNVLIHTSCLVSHDVIIGDHCEVSPSVSLLGAVNVGERTSLGAGCVVLPNVKIGSDVRVGAGAVVTRDVRDGVTVIGVPAREMVSSPTRQ